MEVIILVLAFIIILAFYIAFRDEILKFFKNLLFKKKVPEGTIIDDDFELALENYEEGDFDFALKIYSKIIDHYEKNLYPEYDDLKEAKLSYISSLLRKGYILLRKEQDDEAVEYFKKVVEQTQNPEEFDLPKGMQSLYEINALLELGTYYVEKKQFDLAIEYFEKYTPGEYQRAFEYEIGKAYQAKRDNDKALKYYEKELQNLKRGYFLSTGESNEERYELFLDVQERIKDMKELLEYDKKINHI